ncbi:MAG TPA: polysaccharide deacetylase family protein [Thermomicrobiales bacterium]|nr:polysaccharide deacetylase family protein [Thermomicrobiales bacterium]
MGRSLTRRGFLAGAGAAGALLALAPVGRLALPAAAAASAQVIGRFATTEPVVALTFDAGADRGNAAAILDTLAAKGVRASFGMTGLYAQANPDVVRRVAAEGHHLINHTWDHRSFTGFSTGQAALTAAERAGELGRTADLVLALTGEELKPYFRPPYGDYDASVLQDVAALGYPLTILWTIDTLGWQGLAADNIVRRTLSLAVPGAIVLLHVGEGSRDAAALPAMIDNLRARGYGFATVRDYVENALPSARRAFPETGHTIANSHGFLSFWLRQGGLPVFGFPLTDERAERDPATGQTSTVQYFERQRFEWHPENRYPYDVLLGRLGDAAAARRGLAGTPPFRPLPTNTGSDPHTTFIAATGHRLGFGFRDYWQSRGLDLGEPGVSFRESLALFGYPLSEEFRERLDDGKTYTVQYFERARFEYHPENPPGQTTLLGRLGADQLAAGAAAATALTPPTPLSQCWERGESSM